MSSDRLERKRRSEFDDSDDSADDQPPAKIRKSESSSSLGKSFTNKLKNLLSWLTPTSVKNYMTNLVRSSYNQPAGSTLIMGLGDGMRNNSIEEEEDDDEIAVIAVQNGVPATFSQKAKRKLNSCSENSKPADCNIFPLASTPLTYPEHTERSKATYMQRRQMNGFVNIETINQQQASEKVKSSTPITNPSSDIEILLEKNKLDDKDVEIVSEIPAPLSRKNKYSSYINGIRLDKVKYFENLINGVSARPRKTQKPFTAIEVFRLKEKEEYSFLLKKLMKQNLYVPSQNKSPKSLIQIDLTEDEDADNIYHFKKEKVERVSDFVNRYCKPCALVSKTTINSESQIPSSSADADSDDDIQLISDLPKFTPRKKLSNGSLFSTAWIEELKTTIEIDKRKHLQLIAEQNEKLERYKKRRDAKLAIEKRRRDELQLAGVIFPEEVEMEEEVFPEITPEMVRIIKAALGPGDPNEHFSSIDRLSLTRNDLSTLSGLNWLNDQVINFYLALIAERSKLDNYPTVHTFNSFFYTSLKTRGNAGVLRWTRKIDIFSHDLILVPLHLGMHWALITVDNRTKKIKYYDSMGCSEEKCLRLLNEYLVVEMMDKQKKVLDPHAYSMEIATDIPKQMNGSDCGMFTLKYAEYISRDAPITFNQNHMPYFRQRMVYELITKQIL